MNISKVGNVSFGNVYLANDLKKNIVKNRPTSGDIKDDNEYRKNVEKLLKKCNTGRKKNLKLEVHSRIEEGEYITNGWDCSSDECFWTPTVKRDDLYLGGREIGNLRSVEINNVEEGKKTLTNGDYPEVLDDILKFFKENDIKKIEKEVVQEKRIEKLENKEEIKIQKKNEKIKKANDNFFKNFLA